VRYLIYQHLAVGYVVNTFILPKNVVVLDIYTHTTHFPYPEIHYFYPKAQNSFFTTQVSIFLSAMPTSPSSTLCTDLRNTPSFAYFSYTALCACYMSRPIHPHIFGHPNNIREIWRSSFHKLLHSPVSPYHFSSSKYCAKHPLQYSKHDVQIWLSEFGRVLCWSWYASAHNVVDVCKVSDKKRGFLMPEIFLSLYPARLCGSPSPKSNVHAGFSWCKSASTWR
jgi:hypothetical protein